MLSRNVRIKPNSIFFIVVIVSSLSIKLISSLKSTLIISKHSKGFLIEFELLFLLSLWKHKEYVEIKKKYKKNKIITQEQFY